MEIIIVIVILWMLSHLQTPDDQVQSAKPKDIKSKRTKKEPFATVEKKQIAGGYAIRQKEVKKTLHPILDEKKLHEFKQQTKIAQELLSDIFTKEETDHLPESNTSNAVIETLQKLLEKDTWQKEELQGLLGANVMIGNMLEQINDYAYSKVEDIVVEEDGDTIYVTTEYKEQLI